MTWTLASSGRVTTGNANAQMDFWVQHANSQFVTIIRVSMAELVYNFLEVDICVCVRWGNMDIIVNTVSLTKFTLNKLSECHKFEISDIEVAQPSFSGSVNGLASYVAYAVPLPLEYSVDLSFKIRPTTLSQISLLAFLGQTGYHDDKSDHLAISFIQGIFLNNDLRKN